MDTQCEEQELFIDKCTVYIVIIIIIHVAEAWAV